MKIVLRHRLTGRYYSSAGRWVRRADNALTFEEMGAAREFLRVRNLDNAQPVQRLAPYMMSLLGPSGVRPAERTKRHGAYWYLARLTRFIEN
jgi:hypothetical protein